MYNTIVIGAGAAGAAAARVLAENGRQVLVVERRDHVGGNCYDCQDAMAFWYSRMALIFSIQIMSRCGHSFPVLLRGEILDMR